VVAGDRHDLALRTCGRQTEPVARALDDQHRNLNCVELVQPAGRRLVAAPRRLQRERETQDGNGAGLRSGAAGDARAERATADDQRHVDRELLDHRDPRSVQLARGRRGTPSGYPVRLLHERHADPLPERSTGCRDQIRRLNTSPGAVSEHQCRPRVVQRMDVDPRWPVWGVDLVCQHRRVHVSVTRVSTGDQPIENATIVGQEMHRWLRETEGFRGMLVVSREGTSLGLTFWESREAAERQRAARMSFLERMMSVASGDIEEIVEYEVTFADVPALLEP
jgi:hypothetical protein